MTMKAQLSECLDNSEYKLKEHVIGKSFVAAHFFDETGIPFSPFISASEDGEVTFEWVKPEQRLGLSVEDDGNLTYFWVDMKKDLKSGSGEVYNLEEVSSLIFEIFQSDA